jgi:hypothetical protein
MLLAKPAPTLKIALSRRYDDEDVAGFSRQEAAAIMDYAISPHTRRCAATGRELKPGDRFCTALIDTGARWERRDFAAEAWQGPPADAFSFWTGRVPPDQDHRPRFDDDALEECFHRLADELEPAKVNFRYVVALLLMRRKRLKLEQTKLADGQELLIMLNPRTAEKSPVVNPRLSEDQVAEVQDEVFKVLGWS